MSVYADTMDNTRLYIRDPEGLFRVLNEKSADKKEKYTKDDLLDIFADFTFSEVLGMDEDGLLDFYCNESYIYEDWLFLAPYLEGQVEWLGGDGGHEIWLDIFHDGKMRREDAFRLYPDDIEKLFWTGVEYSENDSVLNQVGLEGADEIMRLTFARQE